MNTSPASYGDDEAFDDDEDFIPGNEELDNDNNKEACIVDKDAKKEGEEDAHDNNDGEELASHESYSQ